MESRVKRLTWCVFAAAAIMLIYEGKDALTEQDTLYRKSEESIAEFLKDQGKRIKTNKNSFPFLSVPFDTQPSNPWKLQT